MLIQLQSASASCVALNMSWPWVQCKASIQIDIRQDMRTAAGTVRCCHGGGGACSDFIEAQETAGLLVRHPSSLDGSVVQTDDCIQQDLAIDCNDFSAKAAVPEQAEVKNTFA